MQTKMQIFGGKEKLWAFSDSDNIQWETGGLQQMFLYLQFVLNQSHLCFFESYTDQAKVMNLPPTFHRQRCVSV